MPALGLDGVTAPTLLTLVVAAMLAGTSRGFSGFGAALIFTGPGAPEGHTLGRVSMLDVAPTVARMLGVTLPDAEGRPLLS